MRRVFLCRTNRRLRSILLLVASVASALLPVTAAEILDRRVGDPGSSYQDAEFWSPTLQMTWQDPKSQEIWITGIDPASGSLVPEDGRGTNAGVAAPLSSSLNGPEWGLSRAHGLSVYFTRPDARNVNQIYRYSLDEDAGSFVTRGGMMNRNAAIPSTSLDAEFAAVGTINLRGLSWSFRWRYENEPDVDRQIPIAIPGNNGPRWAENELKIGTTAQDDEGTQIALYDIVTDQLEVVTRGPGKRYDGRFFKAPEFDGRSAFWCTEDGNIALYVKGEEGYERQTSIVPLSSDGQTLAVGTTQPFTYQGRSYLTFSASRIRYIPPANIYVVGLDWERPLALTDEETTELRFNPEALITADEAYIYYLVLRGLKYELHVVSGFLPEAP